ncbi:Rho guanine nucleotide exchange factor 4, partial [Nowakowskiella sp. JEL0078]
MDDNSSISVSADIPPPVDNRLFASALWDYVPIEDNELEFKAGDIIDILMLCNEDWYQGRLGKSVGYFPANRVKIVNETKDSLISPTSRTKIADLTPDIRDESISNEIISDEMILSAQQSTLSVDTVESISQNSNIGEESSPTLEIITNYISSDDTDVDQPTSIIPLQINIIEATPTNAEIIAANIIPVQAPIDVDPFADKHEDLSSYYFVANPEIQPEDLNVLNNRSNIDIQDLTKSNVVASNNILNDAEDFVEVKGENIKSENNLSATNSDVPLDLKENNISEISPSVVDQNIPRPKPIVDQIVLSQKKKDWIEVKDEEGQTYFWNIVTQETSWTHPDQTSLDESSSAEFTPIQTIYKGEDETVEITATISSTSAISFLNSTEIKSPTSITESTFAEDFDPQSVDLIPAELVRREGYLSVKGKKQNSNSGTNGTWKTYWAVVCVGFLIFYKEQSSKLKKNEINQPVM